MNKPNDEFIALGHRSPRRLTFSVRVPVGEIEQLVERLAVGPFRHADTEAYRKVIKTARLIPILQETLNPVYRRFA